MKIYSQIIFLLLTIVSFANAQKSDDEIIAEIGPIKITAGEFKKRYEMVPHVGRDIKGRENRLKAETLYSIISEKLWALEAEDLGFDSTDVMNYTFQAVEDMYLRDALYQKEIKSKLSKEPAKYYEAKKRALVYLNTKFIFTKEKNEIDRLYEELKNGASFDSLLSLRGESLLQKDEPYQIHFGQMAEFAEDSVYSLSVGEFSNPLKSEDGWYIFKLVSVESERIEDDKQVENMEKNIRRVVEGRKEDNVFQDYYRSFFPGHEVQTNGDLFWSFSDKIIIALRNRKNLSEVKDGKSIHLEAGDFYKIKDQFSSDSLNMIFIQLKNDPITLRQFLYSFAFEGFYSASVNPDIIRGQLSARVKRFIEHELLTREANKQNLNDNLEVKNDIEMWRNYYLGTLYKQTLFDSSNVTDAEVLNYYNKKKSSKSLETQVKVIEIYTDSLEVIEKVFSEIEQEIDFKEISKKYSNRQSGNTNVDEEFFPITSHGEIGRIAGTLNIGEIYGPIEVEGAYVIFKVVDKKEAKEKIPDSFDEIKGEFKRQLKADKIKSKMIENTVKLANKYGVKVNQNILYNMDVTNYNMMVYRYMGFGGRLLAVPMTPNFIEWVEPWQRSQSELP